MKAFFVLLFFTLFNYLLFSQERIDSSYMNYSLEELLNLNVELNVSSFSGDVLFKTPSVTSVIDKNIIQKFNFRTVGELLETVAGIDVGRTYLKREIVTSRGILQDNYANKVLIMINGVPSWNAVTGEGNINRIDVNDIERIEILKGPASVLYGTNAYSGAINIVLKEKGTYATELVSEIGGNNLIRVNSNVIFQNRNLKGVVCVGANKSDGYEFSFTDEFDSTGSIREFVNFNYVTLDISGVNSRLFTNIYSGEESFLGVIPSYAFGAGKVQRLGGQVVQYIYIDSVFNDIEYQAGMLLDNSYRNISRSQSDVIRSSLSGYRTKAFFRANFPIVENFDFTVGIDAERRYCIEYKNYNTITQRLETHEWVEADTILDGNNGMAKLTQNEASFFAQVKAKRNKLTGILGARQTINGVFGNNLSLRASAVYLLNNRNSVKLIYGESFRAPSFFETNFLYPTVVGNVELKPETGKNLELAYQTSFNSFYIQAVLYSGVYKDKITRQIQTLNINNKPIEVNTYQNGNSFSTQGCELEIKYANPKLATIFVNYNYFTGNKGDAFVESREIDDVAVEISHYNNKYAPKHTLSWGVMKEMKWLIVSTNANYTSEVATPHTITYDLLKYIPKMEGERIPHQFIWNAGVQFNHYVGYSEFQHSLSVKNILNTEKLLPEYTRRGSLDRIPSGYGRLMSYSLHIML